MIGAASSRRRDIEQDALELDVMPHRRVLPDLVRHTILMGRLNDES